MKILLKFDNWRYLLDSQMCPVFLHVKLNNIWTSVCCYNNFACVQEASNRQLNTFKLWNGKLQNG